MLCFKNLGIFIAAFLFFTLIGCGAKTKHVDFSHHPLDYYYQLISFSSDSSASTHNKVVWLSASFKTQSDSVFWDSFNNLNDKFYLDTDTLEGDNFLKNYLSQCVALDSACVLIKTKIFFEQQFKSAKIPFFSKKDSIVKINFKVKQILTKEEFVKIKHNLKEQEELQIEHFLGSASNLEEALDPLGFYWIERPPNSDFPVVKPGDIVTIWYEGHYLNRRFLESASGNFELVYGTPDQLLKGLNYVIGYLKLGENAKIILPSRLAFGENGSSNGIVPPYSPLLYELRIVDIKQTKTVSKGLKHKKTKQHR